MALGIYVVVISISGSAVVYRRNFDRKKPVMVTDLGRPRMPQEQLEQTVRRVCPACEILSVTEPDQPGQADSVVLAVGKKRIERLFDPYTGQDLGDPRSAAVRTLSWLADLHENLLLGLSGRTLNGIASAFVGLLSLTGAIIWWPGIANWRRSLTVKRKARPARVNYDLHSAIGFWCYVFVLIWAISGVCLCFPGAFDFLLGPQFRLWMTRLHFGRFNRGTEALWTILGFAPAALAVTGALMWWNRVLSKKLP